MWCLSSIWTRESNSYFAFSSFCATILTPWLYLSHKLYLKAIFLPTELSGGLPVLITS